MKKAAILILTLGLSLECRAQKPEYYYNDFLDQISQSEFDSIPDCYLKLYYDVDTAIINLAVDRSVCGTLDSGSMNLIRADLMRTSGQKIRTSDIIVVNYYPGKDSFNSGGDIAYQIRTLKAYARRVKWMGGVAQFNIYRSPDGLERYQNKIKWYPDLNHRIEKYFFEIHYPFGSYVVILPTGDYLAYKGEYDTKQIIHNVKYGKLVKSLIEQKENGNAINAIEPPWPRLKLPENKF